MPFVSGACTRLHYRADGHDDKPALLLLNSLGTDLSMWDRAVTTLVEDFFVLRMDTRGHGDSGAPGGPYEISDLATDALAVMDAANVPRAHVCGLSMGGMTGMVLALRAPRRVDRLVVCNSSAEVPAEPWIARANIVREQGMAAIVDAVMQRFFSEPFRGRNPPDFATARRVFLQNSAAGYAECCLAISRLDLFGRLGNIEAPTLVVNGSLDEATPPEAHGERIAEAIPGARSLTLATGHVSALEMPDVFAQAITDFLR